MGDNKTNKSLAECLSLASLVAVVTGGIVRRLHEAGARVVIADVDLSGAELLSKELNTVRTGSALPLKVDVTQEKDVEVMVQTTVQQFGSLDILVNNAGIYPQAKVSEMPLSLYEKVMDVNLKGAFLCTQASALQMKKQGGGGKIINITSIDALHPSMTGLAHYDASKHGLWGFTKNVALELAEDNICVNAIAPGMVQTRGVNTLDPKILEPFFAKIPLKRMGDPDEIGKVALFLASDLSSYMTGSQIVVDGGSLLK